MKTKRTLFSIVVFLSVFWVSIIVDFNNFSHPKPSDDNVITEEAAKISINDTSYIYGNVASVSDRLYLYEETDAGTETDQNMYGTDGEESQVQDELLEFDDEAVLSLSDSDDLQTEEPEEHSEPTPSLYGDIGISIAKSYVNIRDKATTDSEINGKLYKDSAAQIIDSIGDWYYIESGSVKGYVNSEYIKTDIPDEELIDKYGSLRISVGTEGLNVRENPDVESKKLTVIYSNEIYSVIELKDEWVKIDIKDDKVAGYVSKEYVELLVDFEKAVSKEEEKELKKLQEEEKVKKATEIKYRDEVDYAQDELKLLACLVHAEAGNQSYEGKLAVANVVLNRVKSSKYPKTMKGVIYQSGQFTVASSGSLTKQLDRYANYSSKSQQLSIKAAKAALSGENNIGSRLYFNGYKSAVKAGNHKKNTSIKIEDHLFW